jgi:hypothetical protein
VKGFTALAEREQIGWITAFAADFKKRCTAGDKGKGKRR